MTTIAPPRPTARRLRSQTVLALLAAGVLAAIAVAFFVLTDGTGTTAVGSDRVAVLSESATSGDGASPCAVPHRLARAEGISAAELCAPAATVPDTLMR